MAEVPLPTPTQVPVPSTDIRNAVFAGAKLDEEVTGSGEYYTDRLGVNRLTNTGRNNQFNAAQADKEARFQQFLLSSGYVFLGDYEDGPFQFSARNQYIRYDNQYYRLNAATDVGFMTTGTDAASFTNDVTHFVLMDGDTLRQNLGSSEAGLGLSLVRTIWEETAQKILKRIYGFNICAYGARSAGEDGYSEFDSRQAIQDAIDAAHAAWQSTGHVQNVIVPPGVFLTSTVPAVFDSGTVRGKWSFELKSGVCITGGGTIKWLPGTVSASDSLVRFFGTDQTDDNYPSDISIERITLDGDAENQAANVNAHGVWIYVKENTEVINCTFKNMPGCGASVRGSLTIASENISISGCQVYDCGNIGLQVTAFDGLNMTANIVKRCADNGIDVYGNNTGSAPIGTNFSIVGNTVSDSLTGVFLETVADGVVTGNNLSDNTQNVHVNRIISQPRNIAITGNTISGGLYGIRVQADTRGLTIEGNTMRGCTVAMLRFGNSTDSNASYINVRNNTFIPLLATTYILWIGGLQASRITVKNNTVDNTVGLTSEYLYHNQATTSFAVVVDNWNFWGGSLGNTGTERYAEGTFTPGVAGATTGGTGTYSNQYGKYTRIGNLVHFTLSVTWTAHTGSGPILVQGLPFTSTSDAIQPSSPATAGVDPSVTSGRLFMRNVASSMVAQLLFNNGSAATSYPQLNAAGGTVTVSGFYFATT
ncbi:right-handed parallel beta-helix repeat-containing protein [Klebsiella variicola]|uniref:right-handed parallel beta-helix repeat-containing protein n=1 Tax=Klebsiella variicola TaxID=244366 RepID=UPI00210C9E0C|nr:right-handed parallel beta-helix repeat-containing protein [Klebsiella variicola]MCQ3882469.1 right-handed parallel beta-helix repeat-containing protein [Klebsiella variicola]